MSLVWSLPSPAVQPSPQPFQPPPGAFDRVFDGIGEAFVAKLDTTATGAASLIYSTFLGGRFSDSAHGIAVDGDGNAFVVGQTISDNFPTTAGAVSRSDSPSTDAFATKLNATGSGLLWSSYLGGGCFPLFGGSDVATDAAVDAEGNSYVTGWTSSSDFPVTSRSFDPTFNGGGQGFDAFLVKLATTPQAQIGIIIQEIDFQVSSGALSQGHGEALSATLQGAIRELNRGNPTGAVNVLRSFISQVNSINRQSLTEAQAQQLIDWAIHVITFITESNA